MAYETTTGDKYNSNLSTTAIAALVREEIKTAVRCGKLPRAKYSVRSDYYSMGSSIHVKIRDVAGDFRVYNAERLRTDRDGEPNYGVPWMSDEARALVNAIEAMLSAYNRVSSEPQSDYYNCKFHANVDFETRYENACRERELATLPPKGSPDTTPAPALCPEDEAVVADLLASFSAPAANDLTDEEDARLEARNDAERAELAADHAHEALMAGGFAEGDWS